MSSIFNTFLTFWDPIGLTVILVYFYGSFNRSQPSMHHLSAVMGVVFGLATWIAMAKPIIMSEGIIIDLRSLFIGVSAAFFGWRAGLITLCMAVTARLGIGGAGMAAGLVGMSIASIMGLMWAAFVRPRITNDLLCYVVLGAMISIHLLGVFVLPLDIAILLLSTLAPFIVISNLIGTMIFSLLIRRERSLAGHEINLRHAATTDPLTSILNRRSVVNEYNALGKSRRGLAMICIDVDAFKAINDTHGHLAGDLILVEVAKRMSSCLRPSDLLARMSGDEFLIVLTNIANSEARNITARCRKIVSDISINSDGADIGATISAGMVWSYEFEDFDTLRNAADTALYRAKNQGGNRVVFHGADDHMDLSLVNDWEPVGT